MAYVKNTWTDNVSPLSATRMNNLEDQYAQVKAELAEAGTSDITVHAKNITNSGDGSGLDAEQYGTLRWVKPGDTVLLESLAEVTNNTGAYVIKKAFWLVRPGKYRLTGELKSSNGNTASIQAQQDGTAVTAEYTTTSTDYVAFSLDFTVPVIMARINIMLKVVTAATVSLENVRIKYADGVPASLVASEITV